MMTTVVLVAALSLSAWRGEELYAPVPRSVKLGEAPAPLSMKVGSLRSVAYQEKPKNDDWRTAFDRVQWGSDVGGPRVVSIRVPRDAKPGEYAIGELTLKVVDRTLPEPKDRKFHLDLWQHPWAVARWNKCEPFSKDHYRAMLPLWKLLANCGQRVITTTIVPLPWNHQCHDGYGTMVGVRETGKGKFAYDYSVFDTYVEFAKRCGLGPQIACYSMAPWGDYVRWTGPDGKEKGHHLRPGTPEFAAYWKPFLADFTRHLKSKGWLGDAYIALDERPPEAMKPLVDFIREHGKGLKVSAAGNRKPSEYAGIVIDNFSLSIQYVTDDFVKEAHERAKEGKTTTTYVCCGPYMPNTFMCSEPCEAHWLAVYQKVAGFSGLLRWAYNSWPEDPMCDGSNGNWWSGDTFLVYPDGSPSARLLMLNNGIQAAEKWRICEEKGLFKEKLAEIASRYRLKTAFSTQLSYFRDLARDTDAVLNGE